MRVCFDTGCASRSINCTRLIQIQYKSSTGPPCSSRTGSIWHKHTCPQNIVTVRGSVLKYVYLCMAVCVMWKYAYFFFTNLCTVTFCRLVCLCQFEPVHASLSHFTNCEGDQYYVCTVGKRWLV